jgi:peptidyl-prolyl cis-trans isomerase B (cyclophilin B)
MANPRNPKRARKKENRNARREEWQRYVERRRRQRFGVLLGSLIVIGVGVLIAFVAFKGGDKEKASATPAASASADASTEAITVPIKKPVACGAELPKSAGSKKKQYSKPADQKLDPDKTYIWHMETSCGDIDIELDVENAPKTTNSIAFLAREGFYDGTFFHRIIQKFMNQGGDPKGDGTGGPGYQVVDTPAKDTKYPKGGLAMAKGSTDPAGASGSQFFLINDDSAESKLEKVYASAGHVVDGIDVVDKIAELANPQDDVSPKAWAYIERSTIVEQ